MEALKSQATASDNATDLITNNIDIWTSAIKTRSSAGRGSSKKLDLYGIKKLRELILELAVRGKLVPQDPNDEPASVLLERIAAEKARLVKENKIKNPKALLPINDSDKSFSLPKGWQWCQFGNVVFNRDAERIPLSVDDRRTRKGLYDYYGASGVIDAINDYLFDKPLLLIGEDGANLINRSTPIAFIAKGKYWVNNHAHVLDGLTLSLLEYVCLYINSISLIPYITGTAQPKMNQAKMNGIALAIPPEAEQHRIVAKVDELMALCDQLEQQTEASIDAHATLVETLLTTLKNSADAAELEQNWNRIADHFDTLFTTDHSIDQLKQTVLQLAVMGKLVPQDPNDEPAAVLLEKIAAEKARLVKEKKIKQQKPLPPIGEDEKPFAVPEGWEWSRPDEFSKKITDGEHFKPKVTDSGVYFLSAKDIREEGVSLADPLFISEETAGKALLRCDPEFGDLLIVSRGATVGRLCKVDIKERFCLLGSVILIKPSSLIFNGYLSIVLKSPNAFSQLVNASGSTAQPAIYLRDLKKIVLPVPPLEEQHRIVAKVDQLMTLCDQLKARLQQARQTQLHLADALVEKAVR